jgi:hypothetical protein
VERPEPPLARNRDLQLGHSPDILPALSREAAALALEARNALALEAIRHYRARQGASPENTTPTYRLIAETAITIADPCVVLDDGVAQAMHSGPPEA